MIPDGEMSPKEARQLSDAMLGAVKKCGKIALMIDLSRMNKPSPETRRIIMQSIQELTILGVGFYGAGLILRTALTLVNRGAAIIKGKGHPTYYCATEAEASLWLHGLRAAAVVD